MPILDPDTNPDPPRAAAAPRYPAELARPWRAADGTTLVIRPIRGSDAAAHAEAFGRIPPEDVRRRFFSTLRRLTPAQTGRLTDIDYDREMAFVAIEEGKTRILAVARLVGLAEGEAEFAVIVDPAWKRRGLARHMMERLFDWGREHGVRTVSGLMLADNAPMLAFARALGFELRARDGDPELVEARRTLITDPPAMVRGAAPGGPEPGAVSGAGVPSRPSARPDGPR